VEKIKLIAETAWHHDGDFAFMDKLVEDILEKSRLDIFKMHVTLDFDEYMQPSHPIYNEYKFKCFSEEQWTSLINRVRERKKKLLLLYNDTQAVKFGVKFDPEYVEIHSACLNDIYLLDALRNNISSNTCVVFGVGGSTLYEIENALSRIEHQNIVLMFGFQNFPTRYKDVNFRKIQRVMNLFPEFSYGYADHTAWDEPNNVMITLMGAALGMDFVEKHVTNVYGEERNDWSSAISIEMFNKIAEKIKVLSNCRGDGLLRMNDGEQQYSQVGPMKKAAVLKKDVHANEKLTLDHIQFQRTGETSNMSQLEVINKFQHEFTQDLAVGTVLKKGHLKRKQ